LGGEVFKIAYKHKRSNLYEYQLDVLFDCECCGEDFYLKFSNMSV